MRVKYCLILCCLIFLLLCTGTALSASVVPEEEWNRTYGEEGRYFIWSGQEVEDGGYILAGEFLYPSAEFTDFLLIKTDSAGNEEWNKTFGGEERNEVVWSASQTRDGGYILVGESERSGINGFVVKTDSEGEEEWNKTFEWGLKSGQEASDGGYILAGRTGSLSGGGYDAWLIKTDSNGNEEWNRTFGGASSVTTYSVQETSDGGYILACGISPDADVHTVWLVKADSNGIEEWSRSFENMGYDYIRSVKETTDGGYILAGITRPSGNRMDGNAWLIKTNSDGEEEWSKTFDKGDYVGSYSVQQTSDGGYVFSGYSELSYSGRHDSWLIKTDPNGYEEWNKTFENADDSFIHYVEETQDEGYVLAGHRRVEVSNYLPWLIKLAGEKNPEDPQDPLNEVKELKDYVFNLENVDDSTKNVLTVKLENAIRNLGKVETEKAVSKLEQFTDSVNKLSLQNRISADQADILVQRTQGIIELIEN